MASRRTKLRARAHAEELPRPVPDWDRIRARFASLEIRGTKIPIVASGILVRASCPEELEAATAAALEAMHKGEQAN